MNEVCYNAVTTIIIFSSLMVIFSYNSIYAVLFLVLTYIASSIALLVLKCEFIALILITIYVGAIAVLFLFVVLMLDIKLYSKKTNLFFYSYSIFLSLIFLFELTMLTFKTFKTNPYFYFVGSLFLVNNYQQNLIFKLDKLLDIEVLGQVLSTSFAAQLLIAGLILFLGIVGSVVITLNFSTKKVKDQIFYKQLARQTKTVLTR